MAVTKRLFLFLLTNILVVATIGIVTSLLGVNQYITAQGINYEALLIFCSLWGFGGAFISLQMSKWMAKRAMGVQVLDPNTTDSQERWLIDTVYKMSKAARLPKMPEVGVYQSPELNAFATGPSKSNSLVAVSTGLLQSMNQQEVEGVLAHEISHVANGDMVTLALVQGVVNSFVMFISRIAAFALSQVRDQDGRPIIPIPSWVVVLVFDIVLGILGSMVVAYFSRAREFRADKGGAKLASRESMVGALQALQRRYEIVDPQTSAASFESMKISSHKRVSLFSTHPPLEVRIQALQRA